MTLSKRNVYCIQGKTNGTIVIVISRLFGFGYCFFILNDSLTVRQKLQARLMSQALRKLTGIIKRSNTLLIKLVRVRIRLTIS